MQLTNLEEPIHFLYPFITQRNIDCQGDQKDTSPKDAII